MNFCFNLQVLMNLVFCTDLMSKSTSATGNIFQVSINRGAANHND